MSAPDIIPDSWSWTDSEAVDERLRRERDEQALRRQEIEAELLRIQNVLSLAEDALQSSGFERCPGSARWKPPVNNRTGELNRTIAKLMEERDQARALVAKKDIALGWALIFLDQYPRFAPMLKQVLGEALCGAEKVDIPQVPRGWKLSPDRKWIFRTGDAKWIVPSGAYMNALSPLFAWFPSTRVGRESQLGITYRLPWPSEAEEGRRPAGESN